MSDLICVLCCNTIYGGAACDTSYLADDRRFGPYHPLCLAQRHNVNGAGEYVLRRWDWLYGMPNLIVIRHWGRLPERLAVWAADRLVRLAFRLLGQRGRLVESSEYFHAGMMREPWATGWVSAQQETGGE